jgi:hypothetical protein
MASIEEKNKSLVLEAFDTLFPSEAARDGLIRWGRKWYIIPFNRKRYRVVRACCAQRSVQLSHAFSKIRPSSR